ncbi:TPA: hypothetical protein ACGU7D_004260 [Vibrio vulnificus]
MLLKKMRRNHGIWNFRHEVDSAIKDHETLHGPMTKEETLTFLFGDWNNRAETNLDIYLLEQPEKTVLHRLNHLWAFPLTFILAPFRYVLYGDIGWTNKTKLGKFLLKSCGFHKD